MMAKSQSPFIMQWAVFVLLLIAFLLTRLYLIQTSFFYLNDMGRDSLTLLSWQQSQKPPLLGPQTSALPFNQSAFYFYLLYPAFILSHGSPYAALYTLNIFYVLLFSGTFYLLKKAKRPKLMNIFLLAFGLLILQPQMILQNRFVWNPSFVAPLILLAFFTLVLLREKFSNLYLIILGSCLALAVSFTYSVAPIVIGFGFVSVWLFRKKVWQIGVSLLAWLAVFNLPTFVFELKHHFLLTNMMLHQPKVAQINYSLANKITNILQFLFTTYPAHWESFLAGLFVTAALLSAWLNRQQLLQFWQKPGRGENNEHIFTIALIILLPAIFLNFLVPVPILAHYIFGLLTIGVILVATMPIHVRALVLCSALILWIMPIYSGQYFQPAIRTVQEMQSCYAQYCQFQRQPVYVSLQSGILPFHNGPEHRYLLRQAGCQVKDIETDVNAAREMAVVVEDSQFTFGQTEYAELSAFHPQTLISQFTCQPNLQIVTVGN